MPDLAALARFDGLPTEPRELSSILNAMAGRERGTAVECVGGQSFTLGAVPRGIAVEDRAGGAICTSRSSGISAAFDGRFDNRDEIVRALGHGSGITPKISDTELLVAGFEAWGDEVFARLVGPCVALLANDGERWLRIARDPLGGRRLFWSVRSGVLRIASRPFALIATGDGAAEFDETSIARFVSLRGPAPGRTFFRGVEELPPGAVRLFDRSGDRHLRTVELAPPPALARDRDHEPAFRDLLDQAVSCRMASDGNTAIAMSGGLDSTAVAGTAANLAARRGLDRPLAISWVFRDFPTTDESRWIDAMLRVAPLTSHRLVSDDLWPLARAAEAPVELDSPYLEGYWALRDRTFEIARQAGCSVLLTGYLGDQLWSGARDWLRDLVTSGRLVAAALGVAAAARYESQEELLAHPLRSSLGRLLPASLRPSGADRTSWLTAWGRSLVDGTVADDGRSLETDPVRRRLAPLVAPHELEHLEVGRRDAQRHGIEMRNPFRDRRLVEFMLGVPARLLYRPGETKRLLRRALSDRVPPAVLERRTATSMLPFLDRGLAEGAWPLVRAALDSPTAIWPRYVDPEWLRSCAIPALGRSPEALPRVVIWHCYCLERWRESVKLALAPAVGAH